MKKKVKPREVEVYLDGTDWLYEIGEASDGNRVYPGINSLKEESKCWNECGIVKCRLVFDGWVVNEKPRNWENTIKVGTYDEDAMRLSGAERHLQYLEEKVAKQKEKVIQLKTTIKGK